MPLGQIGSMSGNLVGNHAVLHIIAIWQAEMLFRRNIAEHGAAIPADLCRTDTGCDMIIARRNIGSQRPQCIEWCLIAILKLQIHILLDHLHRHMAGPLDHRLHIMFPGDLREFTQCLKLTKLCRIVGISNGTGP